MIASHMPRIATLLTAPFMSSSPKGCDFIRIMRAMMLCLLMTIDMNLPSRADPTRPPLSLDFNRYLEGRYVYERNCVVCHGPRGDGNGELSPGLNPRPRSFREGLFKFRTTPWGKLPTEDDLRRTITGGLSGTAMGMFQQLRPDEVTAVIEYLKSFSRRWRKPENYAEPMRLAPPPPWLADREAGQKHATDGKVLFANICASCHGASGDGNGPAVPGLKDIWGLPTRPANLRQPHLRCGDSLADIFRVITTGLNGTPMLSFADTLTDEQRWSIVAYVDSLRKE